MKTRNIIAACTSVLLALGFVAVSTTAASAHTHTVSDTCEVLTVDLKNYAAGTPEVPGTPDSTATSYVKWTYNPAGDPLGSTPLTDPDHWNKTGDTNIKDNAPDVVIHKGEGNGSYFYWQTVITPVLGTPGTPAQTNTVTVVIDGNTVEDSTSFSGNWFKEYAFGDKYVAHTWTVTVVAWDDTQYTEHSFTESGTSEPCTRPVDVVACPSETTQPVSTNLNPQGWTLTNGVWVDGGVEFTASNWEDAYASKSVNFPLGSAANLALDTTGGSVWAIILVTTAGNVHYEPEPYSDDLWTNASGVLPANAGGQGGPYSGGLDDLLSNPAVTEVRLYFTSGSATPESGILHSGSYNCLNQPFDYEFGVAPVPALFAAEPTPPTCEADGSFDFSGEFPGVTVVVTPQPASPVAPGDYFITADTNAGIQFPDGTTHKEITVTVVGKIATQSANSEAPCYLKPTPPVVTVTTPDVLASTGVNRGVVIGIVVALVLIIGGVVAWFLARSRKNRNES